MHMEETNVVRSSGHTDRENGGGVTKVFNPGCKKMIENSYKVGMVQGKLELQN